jgi:hypothetical protein
MQTFLPHKCFAKSAASLDNRRLGKQRVECLQILNALHNPEYGWQNHPATKMWRHDKASLIHYGITICDEWIRRGFKDTCRAKIKSFMLISGITRKTIPRWISDDLCASHQSNLVRKFPEHYAQLFPNVPNDLPYVWPV